MQTPEEPRTSPQTSEIDLFQLLIKTILFFRRYSRLFLISILIGLVLGIAMYLKKTLSPAKNFYTGYMICTSSLSTGEITETFNSLSNSMLQKDIGALTKKLSIPENSAKRLINITVQPLFTTKELGVKGNPTLSSLNKLFKVNINFIISTERGEPEPYKFIESIKKSLNYYLNNNQYLKSRITGSLEANRALVKEIDTQLVKLEEMQTLILQQKMKPGVIIEANNGSLSAQVIKLQQKRISLDSAYQLIQPLIVVEDFNITNVKNVTGPSNTKIIAIALSIIIIALIYAMFKELIAMIPPREKRKQ